MNDIHKHINKEISKSSICKVLKQNKITRKKANIRIIAKDIDKIKSDRINFANKIEDNEIIYENVYSIDESSFCINDYKTHGYSNKGVEIKKIKKHKKNKEKKNCFKLH